MRAGYSARARRLSSLALGIVMSASAVAAALGQSGAAAGQADAAGCFACHGADGQGADAATPGADRYPKLAGQHADYLLKQIRNIRGGDRPGDAALVAAHELSDAQTRRAIGYYAAQAVMQGHGIGEHQFGRTLYQQGDTGRNIPPCASCHAQTGEGSISLTAPILAGQAAPYLEQQLFDWRSGVRANSVDGLMNLAAQELTDDEIRALSRYLAAQR